MNTMLFVSSHIADRQLHGREEDFRESENARSTEESVLTLCLASERDRRVKKRKSPSFLKGEDT